MLKKKKKSPATLLDLSLLAVTFGLSSGEAWHVTVFLFSEAVPVSRPRVQLGKFVKFKYSVRVAPTSVKC